LSDSEPLKLVYYPGCTLYTKAEHLNESAKLSAKVLGIELLELPAWTCCGAAFPLGTDTVMGMLAAGRILANTNHEYNNEGGILTTLCAFCYNVLHRTNNVIQEDSRIRDKINLLIEEEYAGNVQVKHFLEVLRDDYGFEALSKKITRPLKDLKIAPYYGCQLLRPRREINFDDPENPSVIENFIGAIGAQSVDYPFKNECCGSYQIISSEDIAVECSYNILNSAYKSEAEAIALSCPLCYYNLDFKQKEIQKKYQGFKTVPVFYFTELLGLALEIQNLDKNALQFDKHFVDPIPLLKDKGVL
jgi:heterodisulfide reductase subunit B